MDRGEPPGRNPFDAERSDGTQVTPKPARIVLRLDFEESETGIVDRGHKGMLDRALRDMLDAATVRTTEVTEGERPVRKTIGVFQGLTAKRVDGLMRYEATVSASQSCADEVREKVLHGIEGMQRIFKYRLENVSVEFAGDHNAADSTDGASVELHHAPRAGNCQ